MNNTIEIVITSTQIIWSCAIVTGMWLLFAYWIKKADEDIKKKMNQYPKTPRSQEVDRLLEMDDL